jgi:cytochrome P450
VSRPPGPGPLAALRLATDPTGRPQQLAEVARRFGDVAFVRIGPTGFYLLSHPELTNDVLTTHDERFERVPGERRLSRWVVRDSMFSSEGELRARERALIEPIMYGEVPAAHARHVVEAATRATDDWQAGQTVDVFAHHDRMITALAARVLFGTDVDAGEDVWRALVGAIDAFNAIPLATTPVPERLPLPSRRRFERALAEAHRLIDEAGRAGDPAADTARNVLALLRRARGRNGTAFSAHQARDEALSLYRGQNTTPASALSWTWYLLSRHPQAEQRFHQELDSTLGDRCPSSDDLPRLPYTLMAFREAQRLYPPVWALARKAIAPHPVREHEIPVGATVVMSQWVHHRDPRFWSDPERFDPERFAGGIADLPDCTYFPQGAGPRRCMGMDFLPMEAVMVLSTIGRRWRLRPASDQPVAPLAKGSLVPRGGIPMVLEPRDGRSTS